MSIPLNRIELWIDQRERHVIPYFDSIDPKKAPPYHLELKTLSAGDYAVVYKNYIIMLIERKSWSDLAASFLDRSRKFNYEKMISERNKFGCRIFYLIEGKRPNNIINRVTIETLEAHLDHLLFDHEIVSIYSQSVEHTPERILSIIKHYMTAHSNPFSALEAKINSLLTIDSLSTINSSSNIKYVNESKLDTTEIPSNSDPTCILDFSTIPILNSMSATDSLKSTKRMSDEAIEYALWNSIEGVTELSYTALKDIKVTLAGLLCGQYTTSQIMHARYRLGTLVGEKKLSSIIASAINPVTHIKVMTQIPNISDNRANIILSKYKMSDIVSGVVTEQQLADIIIPSSKSSSKPSLIDTIFDDDVTNLTNNIVNLVSGTGRKLGITAAKNIIKYLSVRKV